MIGPLTSRRIASLVAVALVAALALGAAACAPTAPPSGNPDARSKPSTTPPGSGATPEATGSTTPISSPNSSNVYFEVYFVKGETLQPEGRVMSGSPKVAQAAIEQLLKGPSDRERETGMDSAVPDGTRLRSVRIASGTATVDFNRAFTTDGGLLGSRLKLAQVVYTLTQFPTVSRVVFVVEGTRIDVLGGDGIDLSKPQTRDRYDDLLPAVLVEDPRGGMTVRSPFHVRGTADVFEGALNIDLTDSRGKVLFTKHVLASSGTGTRGTFEAEVRITVKRDTEAKVVVWYDSPKDGLRVVAAEIPVRLEAP